MSKIKFGTDGWRAIIAEDFTFNNVSKVAQATADYWNANLSGADRLCVVGYDRRFLADEFAVCSAEVLAGNGFKVILTPHPTPTPAVSLAVKQHGGVGGIMITASHNPPIFNGYKLKTASGGPAGPEVCKEVESRLDKTSIRRIALPEALNSGAIRQLDVCPAHYSTIKKMVDFKLIAKSGIRFAHDALFGVGAGCFEHLLANTTCRVTTLNGKHDPLFGGINPEPIEANYTLSRQYLQKHPHDVCLVTDGDADRVGGMDGRGNLVSTHKIMCLLLRHLAINRGGKGRVVKALSTTTMLDKMCRDFGLVLTETCVGFKHTSAEMLKGDVLIGGEESGGIGFAGHVPERDGILAGLYILEMLALEKKPLTVLLRELEKRYGPHEYARRDIRFPVEKRNDLMEYCRRNPPERLNGSVLSKITDFDGVKYTAEDSSWLMLRGSGTESVLRIYAESQSLEKAEKLLKVGLKMASHIAG